MRDDNYTELMSWVAKKDVECFKVLTSKYGELTDFEQGKLQGYSRALEDMRMKLLMVFNPHNREDIRIFNENSNIQEDLK